MYNFFQMIVDMAFPIESQWGSFNCYLKISDYPPEPHFISSTKNIDNIIALSYYSNSAFSELIPRVKNHLEFAIAQDLALFVKDFLDSKFYEIDCQNSVWISVPYDPDRFLKRGFHLPDLVLKKLKRIHPSEINYYSNLLLKTESTPAQLSLNRAQRLNNLQDKITINLEVKKSIQEPKVMILFDDVTTTGTTLETSAKVLKKNFPKANILAIVIASDAGV